MPNETEFKNEIVVMIIQSCQNTKNHWIIQFEGVNSTECELYLNKWNGNEKKF